MHMSEKRKPVRMLPAAVLLLIPGVAACDINPEYPVLDGNGGRSSVEHSEAGYVAPPPADETTPENKKEPGYD